MTKKQQKQLKQLREQADAIRRNIEALENVELREKASALMGKCFKYRNCYSCPQVESDYWWMYAVVKSSNQYGRITLLCFEIDKNGNVWVRTEEATTLNGYTEITANEMCGAWLEVLGRINELQAELERAL